MVQCTEHYGARLDGRRLADMRLAGRAKEICDMRTGCMPHTAVSALISGRWRWNCGGHGVTDLLCHYRDSDSPFTRPFKDVGYERRLGDILGHLQATHLVALARNLTDLIRFVCPCDQTFLVPSW